MGKMPPDLEPRVTEALHTVPRGGTEPGSSTDPRHTLTSASRAAISLVKMYQAARGTRPSPCRYVPSCSQYAAESFERHGLVKGGFLAVRRLGRCRPFGGCGADPVPD